MSSIARRITQWKRTEIASALYNSRRVYKSEELDIRVAPMPDYTEHGRILIIVPRKVGNAPERNRIRRRLKAIFYEEKLYSRGYNWILFIKKPALALPFSRLKDIMLSVAERLLSGS
jgi:ribonuclease P protein component